MSGNDWGGVELMEKLNLMEMAGIGQTPSSNYLINATEFFLFASISQFRFFVSTYLHSTPNGVSILKENLHGLGLIKSLFQKNRKSHLA